MDALKQESGKSERSDAAANRRRILEAAQDVFAQRGLDAEVREIAERAGVGVGTLYRHFESREGLLAALIQQAEEDVLREIQAAAKADDPISALKAMVGVGAGLCERFGALTESVLSGEPHKFPGHEGELMGLLTAVFERGIRLGALRADLDIPLAIAVLKSFFTSGGLLQLAGQRSYSYKEAAEDFSDFFLRAVAAKPQ